MSLRCACCSVVALALAASCATPGSVVIDVHTDLVPGVGFDQIELRVGEIVTTHDAQDLDYLRGVRLPEFSASGRIEVAVRAVLRGTTVVARRQILSVRGATVASVWLLASCRGVTCPQSGGDTTLTECEGGRCVSPECSAERPDLCPGGCAADADCAPVVSACGSVRCRTSRCVFEASGLCGPDEACDFERGCVRLPVAPRDAPLPIDTGPADVPADTGCVATESACDRIDEDCDGITDDDGVCGPAASPCEALFANGTTFLYCATPDADPVVRAHDGWCRRAAPGYTLANLLPDDVTALATVWGSSRAPAAVALENFDGSWNWSDGRSETDGELSMVTGRCGYIDRNGVDDEACRLLGYALCRADLAPGACLDTDEAAGGCDAVDSDCDGRVDEGQDCRRGCTTRTFGDHVYYQCTEVHAWDEAPGFCFGIPGAELAVLSSDYEARIGLMPPVLMWVSLSQPPAAAAPNLDWRWIGSESPTYATLGDSVGWADQDDMDGLENDEENCAALSGVGGRLSDRPCSRRLGVICEAPFRYAP